PVRGRSPPPSEEPVESAPPPDEPSFAVAESESPESLPAPPDAASDEEPRPASTVDPPDDEVPPSFPFDPSFPYAESSPSSVASAEASDEAPSAPVSSSAPVEAPPSSPLLSSDPSSSPGSGGGSSPVTSTVAFAVLPLTVTSSVAVPGFSAVISPVDGLTRTTSDAASGAPDASACALSFAPIAFCMSTSAPESMTTPSPPH